MRRTSSRNSLAKSAIWQNPILEYWAVHRRKKSTKHPKTPRRVRIERQILAVIACFSISIGLWENFRQLWLQDNGLSVANISNVTSFSTVLCIAGVLLVGKFVRMTKIKRFMIIAMITRTLNLLMLFLINGTENQILIYLCTAIDIIISALITTATYPLVTTVMKSNGAYSRRKLVEYLFRDIGVFAGGILIGQTIGGWIVNYNACLMISIIFSAIAGIILACVKLRITEHATKSKFSIVKYVLKNKIQRVYMLYVLITQISWSAATGLKMLMLTDYFDFSASIATNYLLIVGLVSDVLGILALKYFTPQNDYSTMFIKFGVRAVFFFMAFASGNIFMCFIALTWALLSSTAYENVSDGYYINAIDNRHQLKYNTVRHVVNYAGDAIGMFICGQLFRYGVAAIFGVSAIFLVAILVVSFYLIYLRHKKRPQ